MCRKTHFSKSFSGCHILQQPQGSIVVNIGFKEQTKDHHFNIYLGDLSKYLALFLLSWALRPAGGRGRCAAARARSAVDNGAGLEGERKPAREAAAAAQSERGKRVHFCLGVSARRRLRALTRAHRASIMEL